MSRTSTQISFTWWHILHISVDLTNVYEKYNYDNEESVVRVEVSWNGFLLRNWNNEIIFHADPDTGNLLAHFQSVGLNLDNPNDYEGINTSERSAFITTYYSGGKYYPIIRVNNGGLDYYNYSLENKDDGYSEFTSSFSYNSQDWPDEFRVEYEYIRQDSDGESTYSSSFTMNMYNCLISSPELSISSGYFQVWAYGSEGIKLFSDEGPAQLTATQITLSTHSKNISLYSNTNIILEAKSYIDAKANTYVNITANASNLASNAGTVGIHANLNSVLYAETGYITIKSNAPREGTYDWTENTVSIYSTNRAVYIRGYDIGFYMSHYAGSQSGGTGLRGARVRIVAQNSKPSASNDYNILYLPTTGGNVQYIPLGGNG